jgi:5-formyltetrahydrofolate cyclo-ligase
VAVTVKQQLRAELMAARADVGPAQRHAEARALCARVRDIHERMPATVAAYVPVGSEPGSVELLDALLDAYHRVLLPIARVSTDGTPLPLRWAEYRPGDLVEAPFGLLEPPEPWLPPTALTDADFVLVPALAVDRHGVRLGRGSGFYDRSLGLAGRSAHLIAVVRDNELVDDLPAEQHDVPMTHALMPGLGLVALS